MPPRIFISYSRKDELFARQLAQSLSDRGADIWIDLEDIPAGMKWSSAIQQGLDTGEIIIVIISPESMTSRNVEDEWQYFLDNNKPVIPVLLRSAKIHFQLSRIQYIDFLNQPYDTALRQLLIELARKGVHLQQGGDAPVVPPAPRYHASVQPQPAKSPTSRRTMQAGLALVVLAGFAVMFFLGLALAGVFNPPAAAGTTASATFTATDSSDVAQNASPTRPAFPVGTSAAPPAPTAVVLPGFTPVRSNSDWSPIEGSFGGVTMMLVPAGSFKMGIAASERDSHIQQCISFLGVDDCTRLVGDELPQETITFSKPFWIDKYEVSANGRPNDLPLTNVTWAEASLNCQSRGGRLPTEAEWEYAARGPDGWTFPWGNGFAGTHLNYCDSSCEFNWRDGNYEDGYPVLAPVNAFSEFRSWVGTLNMAGNVWEWTSSVYAAYPYNANDGRENPSDTSSKRTLRGGSWNWVVTDARTTGRDAPVRDSSDWYGFRCVRDWQNGDLGG